MKFPARLTSPYPQPAIPHAGRIIIFIITITAIYIFSALMLHPADREMDYHFYSERGLITGLSSLFLSAAGTFAVATIVVHLKAGVRDIVSWMLIALGFYFLSLDEVAQFHERLGEFLDDRFSSGAFRHWNDVIVILYGVIALPILVIIIPSMVRYKITFYCLLAGFGLYFLHTAVDSLVASPTVLSIVVEESAKLFCGAMLVLSMLFSFFGALCNQAEVRRVNTRS